MRLRRLWIDRAVAALVLLLLAALAFPWFATHKGSARSELPMKLRSLILQYHSETGEFPESLEQILSLGNIDLSYRVTFRCQIHPWKHIQRRTMKGGELWIDDGEAEAGLFYYRFRPHGSPKGAPGWLVPVWLPETNEPG